MTDDINQPITQEEILEDIFIAMKLNLQETEKIQLFENIKQTIQIRIFARIMDLLNETDKNQFQSLLDQENKQEIENFIKSKNIDLNRINIEETLLYKAEMIKNAKELDALVDKVKNKN